MSDKSILVLYHANCPDGFCAAWVAHRKLGDSAAYIPVQYGEDPPCVNGKTVYILDFSYKRPVMRDILSRAKKLVVLDHHRTAQAELDGLAGEFVTRVFPPPDAEGPFIHFDMNKSGARLAWEHFFPGEPSPWLVDYVEDRDLWRWKLPDSREINDSLASHPRSFDAWDDMLGVDRGLSIWLLRADGVAIGRYKSQLVDAICRNAREMEIDGHKILAANTPVLISEVAGKLAEGRPFGVAWFVRDDGKRQWSLRSTAEGVDVSAIAVQRGGGGHRNAAGWEDQL